MCEEDCFHEVFLFSELSAFTWIYLLRHYQLKSTSSQKSDLKKEGVQFNRGKHKVVHFGRSKQVHKFSVY